MLISRLVDPYAHLPFSLYSVPTIYPLLSAKHKPASAARLYTTRTLGVDRYIGEKRYTHTRAHKPIIGSEWREKKKRKRERESEKISFFDRLLLSTCLSERQSINFAGAFSFYLAFHSALLYFFPSQSDSPCLGVCYYQYIHLLHSPMIDLDGSVHIRRRFEVMRAEKEICESIKLDLVYRYFIQHDSKSPSLSK